MNQAPVVKPGAPPCGLYLILPPNWMDASFLSQYGDVLRAMNASSYEKNSHVIELRHVPANMPQEQMDMILALSNVTRSQGMVFVIGNDIELAKACEADGVLLDQAGDIGKARSILGDDAIVGVRCGQSRRVAEQVLSAGADYVSFHAGDGNYLEPGLIHWWHLKTDNPCLVEGSFTNDDCAFYVMAGADFMDASFYVWKHPEGVMKGIVNMNYAIELASEKKEKEMMQ